MNRLFSPLLWLGSRAHGLVLPLILVAIWWATAAAHLLPPVVWPGPGQVAATFVTLLQGSLLWACLKSSLSLVAYGFLIGSVGGIVFGSIMGMSKTMEKIALPFFNALRQIPLVAWIPLLILWCGVGETARVIFIAIGASYPMVLNTLAGIRSVPREYIEVANVFQYGRLKLWGRVMLPSALPSIFTGLRLSLAHCWAMVIAAEVFMANVSNGIGNLMVEGGEQFKMDVVIVCIIVIGLIGFAMNQAIRSLESRFLHWKTGFAR